MGNAASGFFAGTGLVDFVIAFTFVEGALLSLWNFRTGRGMPLRDVWTMLLPGMMLMLALRGVLLNQDGLITALFLLGAGLNHGADLLRRLGHYPDKSADSSGFH